MTTTKLFDLYQDSSLKDFVAFEFGGFYHGQHEQNIESALDRHVDYINEDAGTDIDACDYDYNHNQTCINYAQSLLEAIDDKLETNFLDCFVKIDSPKYYNYSTDSIRISKSKANNNLIELIYKDDSTLQALLDDPYFCYDLEFDVAL